MATFEAVLDGGSPWGFRLKGGRGTGLPLVVSKVNPGSKAARAQICIGDTVESINGHPAEQLDQHDAQGLIRSATTQLALTLSKASSLNGEVINYNNNNMSVQTSSSVSGQQNVSNFAVDDETVSVDGVTFHGFSPSNVSVTRTTTTKVTKTTRSRSPSPIRGRSGSSENVAPYPGKQMTMRYDSEPEADGPPVKFMSGVVWTPPGSKGMLHPHSVVIPARSNARNTDSEYCTCHKTAPSPNPTRTTPGHSAKECSHITSRPPRPREPVTQRREPGKAKRHRSSFFIRPRSRSSDASRKAATPWKPVNFQPRSKDDTANYAFSSPPVPPPPPESDSEDMPPVVPPKPKVVKRKLYLSANQPQTTPEFHLKPVTKGRLRKTSRGAEMFRKRQAQLGLTQDADSPEEPPLPHMLATNNNEYPPSPEHSYNPIKFSMTPGTQSAPPPAAQSPPQQDGYHQPVRPQRADPSPSHGPHYVYDSSGDSWPAPPPPVAQPSASRPLHAGPGPGTSPPKPAGWSQEQSNPSAYQAVDNKSPAAWSPAPAAPVKGFKPVKLDLNAKPKPWKTPGASQPEKVNEPAPTSSSQHPSWQPPPPTASQPVPNGDLHSPHRPPERHPPDDDDPGSPYRPSDHDQDRQRYNLAFQRPSQQQQGRPGEPRSPQGTRKPEFRQVPEGYSSDLPRPVSPTVTLLRNQRERDKERRSHADYLPPDSSLMPPSLVAKAPSGGAKQPVTVAKPLHASRYTPVITDPDDLPEGAVFQKQTVDGDVVHTDTYYPVRTREVTKKVVHKEAPQYQGIGPQDETGLPIGLRAHVKEENRHDWYKEMFKTIHKQDRPEDDIDQSYLDALIQEANMYEPSYGFADAVDVKDNDDSVFAEEAPPVVQSCPVRRPDQWAHDPTLDVSPPRSPPHRHHSPNASARNTIDRYHQQPRSIIDYEPGKSSLAEREKSPTTQLYNPPVEPISAVQNTKRSTTLPRDFAQFSQVPAESPSARHQSAKQEEPIRSPSSRPLSSTLPRAKSKSRSLESSGLSAAERLGIKSPPPQRTPSTGSKPGRHSSGSDKIYNYRDPPPTLDKTKAERLIEEERRKKERLQAEAQKERRHSDYTPIKSPIITNERFRDPVISATDDSRKQEVKACAIALYPFKAQSHKELSFNKGDIIYLLRKIDRNWFEGEHHGHAGIFPSSYVEVVTSLEDAKQAQLHGPGLDGKARAKYKFSGETQMELGFNKGEYIVLLKKIDANWWEGSIGDRKGIFPAAYVEVLREPTGVTSSPAPKTQAAASHSPYQPPSQQMAQSSPKHQSRLQAVPSHQPGRSSHGSSGSPGSYGGGQREPARYFEEPVPKPSRTLAAARDLYVASFAYAPQNEDEIELQEGDLVNVLEKCDDGWYVGMSERTGMFGTFPGNYVYKRET